MYIYKASYLYINPTTEKEPNISKQTFKEQKQHQFYPSQTISWFNQSSRNMFVHLDLKFACCFAPQDLFLESAFGFDVNEFEFYISRCVQRNILRGIDHSRCSCFLPPMPCCPCMSLILYTYRSLILTRVGLFRCRPKPFG